MKDLLSCIYLLSILKEDSGRISRYNLKQAVLAADTILSGVLPSLNETDSDDSQDIHGFDRYLFIFYIGIFCYYLFIHFNLYLSVYKLVKKLKLLFTD